MPRVEIIKQSDLSVYLMEIDSFVGDNPADCLTEAELEKLKTITHPDKINEFIASRHLRTEVFGKQTIKYTEVGAPYLDHDGFISISHTTNLVGIAFSPDFKVGLDLECIRQKAADLSSRFVHESEKKTFNISSPEDMSLLWSLKETLYKVAGRKGILFSQQLIVEKEDGQFTGYILHEEGKFKCELATRTFAGKIITCNTSALTQTD